MHPSITPKSPQFLARNWRENPAACKNEILKVARHKPNFSYKLLEDLLFDWFALGVPKEDIQRGIRDKVKREQVRRLYLEIVDAVTPYMEANRSMPVLRAAPQYFRLAPNVLVPYRPIFSFKREGKIIIPHISMWRTNPYSLDQFGLFVSLIRRSFSNSADLRRAHIEFVDCSAESSKHPRLIRITEDCDLPAISAPRFVEMIATYREGLFLADKEKQLETPAPKTQARTHDTAVDKGTLWASSKTQQR